MDIKKDILDKVNEWLTPTFDHKTKEAIKEMRRCAGTQFDPDITRIFIEKVLGKE